MKKMINKVVVEGYVYENELKISAKNYINGKINVLTFIDDETGMVDTCELKVLVGPTYSKTNLKPNPNFNVYKSIMENENTYLQNGTNATKVSITGSIDGSYFVPKGVDVDRQNVISSVQNKAPFISFENDKRIVPSATFETDMYITEIVPEMTKVAPDSVEPSTETGNYLVKGYIFDYRGCAISVTYIAKTTNDGSLSAADYFSNLATDVPIFTKVWGNIHVYQTTVEKTEASPFGKAKVVSFKATKKEYEITGTSDTPYMEGLTAEEFQASLQARETKIAEALEYQKNRTNANTNVNTFSSSIGGNTESINSIASSFGSLGKGEKFNF